MRLGLITSAIVTFSFVTGVTALACAEPSIWQRAENSALPRQERLLNRIERLLAMAGLPDLNVEFSAGAVALFQLSDARFQCDALNDAGRAGALDPRLEYLIGGALVQAEIGRETDARCLLERALREAPTSPLAATGYFDLALVEGKLGDHKAERRAYLRALTVTWDPDARANIYGNLAESDMGAGDLMRAVAEYRIALAASQQADSLALAYYGLAVALDRAGDWPSAIDAAKQAIAVRLPAVALSGSSVLDLPTVSFLPSYEVHYYRALGAMAAARLAKDNAARRAALMEAAEHWGAYLVGAEADHIPWARTARLHQLSVERELRQIAIPRSKPK